MNNSRIIQLVGLASVAFSVVGCVSPPPPPPPAPTLENYQETAIRAVNELLVHNSIKGFGRKPRIQLGQVDNRTLPFVRIPVEQVAGRIQESLLDSGQVTIFKPSAEGAAKRLRDDFINDNTTPTSAGTKNEPDYFLQGDFMSIRNNQGKNIITFQLRLTGRDESMVWQRSIDVAVGNAAIR